MTMPLIHTFDSQNYDPAWPRISREAVRAVIVKNDQIALVKSATEGWFKFPGGGVDPGESHLDALLRETTEETGLRIAPASVRGMGFVHELRKSVYCDEIFEQHSYYYFADTEDAIVKQRLDDYEKEFGYELAWTGIATAYQTNTALWQHYQKQHINLRDIAVLRREAFVLKTILET